MQKIADQRHRMNRVTNFIRENLEQQLDLEHLSDVACLSKYHFLRTFRSFLNETPNQYVSRLRLEAAASKLVYTQESPITNLALDIGFSGSDTFSRSFTNRFGVSPRKFRELNKFGFSSPEKLSFFADEIYKPGEELTHESSIRLNAKTELRPEYHVAYIRHIGPYGDVGESITKTFRLLQDWAEAKGILKSNSTFIGRCTDNCGVTPSQYCLYDACMVLKDEVSEDDVVSIHKIPASKCAVLSVTCPPAQLNRMWNWLSFFWLPQNKMQRSFNSAYEYFRESGRRKVSSVNGVEICLPIV